MKPEPVLKAIKAQPFRRFIMTTAGGREFLVDHPEFVAISPGSRLVVVTYLEGGYDVLDLSLVETLTFPDVDGKGAA